MAHTPPSDRARALVRDAYDLHVHIAPDLMTRRIDDVTLSRIFLERGLAGFVLKSHYVPTQERAASVRAAVPGIDAVGAITLNRSVGGMNPVAVEIAARGGARFVWFPTVDSENQRTSQAVEPEGATPPMWAALQQELFDQGMAAAPVPVVVGGEVTDDVRAVLGVIARHDLVLATGHVSADEVLVLVRAAAEQGVRRIVVTHPEFTSQRMPVDRQREAVEYGALLERCLTTPLTGKVAWETWLEHIRAVGPEHSVLSTDLGQPFNPPVEDGLAIMADVLLEAGFAEAEVQRMAVENTRRLVLAGSAA